MAEFEASPLENEVLFACLTMSAAELLDIMEEAKKAEAMRSTARRPTVARRRFLRCSWDACADADHLFLALAECAGFSEESW